MSLQTMKITSACDGLPLGVAVKMPEAEIKGVVQISHGMSEHKERYYDFMSFLADNGYISVIHDHRGHGESVKSPEDFGYMYDDKARFIVEDLHQITLWIKEQFPRLPLYLFGHSMGSLMVRQYTKEYDADIDKLIVCGSPSQNAFAGMGLRLVDWQIKKHGDHYRSPLVNKLAFMNNNKRFADGTSENLWLSSNRENVQKYDDDIACGFVFTLNGFKNLFSLMQSVYNKKGWQVNNPQLPVLFVAGADDPVIIKERAWFQSIKFMRNRGYQQISYRLYPDMRHEILNETDNKKVYNDILKWLDSSRID